MVPYLATLEYLYLYPLRAGSCAIDYQIESVLAQNNIESYNFQFTYSFLFSAKTIQLVNWT